MMEQKILELVAKTPGIRTMQLADKLDLDIEATEKLLLPMVDAGQLVAAQVDAPNNRKATGFSLPGALTDTEIEPAAPEVGASYGERAEAHIKANGGRATTRELAEHLNVSGSLVSAYLGSYLKSGRLHRSAGVWTCSGMWEAPANKPITSLAKQQLAGVSFPTVPGAGRVKTEPVPHVLTPKENKALPAELVREISKGNKKQAEQDVAKYVDAIKERHEEPKAAPAGFRCCMWSDGVLELQQDGRTVLELDMDEQKLVKRALGYSA